MADQHHEVDMTMPEKMDTARTVLAVEATKFMLRNQLPDSGQGTVTTEFDGVQHIAGINDGFSRLAWRGEPSRTVDGAETRDTNNFGLKSLVHTKTKDAANPYKSADEFQLIENPSGIVSLDLKGSCQIVAGGDESCSFDVTSRSGEKGKVNFHTSKVEQNPAAEAWDAKTLVSVTDAASETREALLDFQVSKNVATYEYNRLTE